MAIIYATAGRDRFFLVPEGVVLAEGELGVQTLTGVATKVDEKQIAAYEIPEATAKEHVERRVAAVKKLVGELTGFAAAMKRVSQGLDDSGSTDRERAAKVLGMIGVTPEELERDPQATLKVIGERLRAMADEKLAALAGG